MIEDVSFPTFRLELHRRGQTTKMHLDAVAHFLTTPPDHMMDDELVQ